MPHGRKSPGLSSPSSASKEPSPRVVPRRKRPLLLAVAVALLIAWLGFLAVLAFLA